jgi:hypothetical protein
MVYGWNNYSFVTSPKTGNLSTGAVTTLGCPGLIDGGRIMQRTDGPTYTTTIDGAGQLWQGSNFTDGSSGGPWVVNFRPRSAVLSGGATEGSASVIAVIEVTSWGSDDPNGPKDNYSSQFRQNSRYPDASYGAYGAGNIASLLNTLCSSAAPGGGTLASKGLLRLGSVSTAVARHLAGGSAGHGASPARSSTEALRGRAPCPHEQLVAAWTVTRSFAGPAQ